ncbi:hypothetical protein CASFOL_030386 [Castilleja foliolosa]|uniref:Uncharacterized protein n=1 Tax=Castilleja foliolosa TaxID=1961234 RepID=A0ABD3C8G9_9LAMI
MNTSPYGYLAPSNESQQNYLSETSSSRENQAFEYNSNGIIFNVPSHADEYSLSAACSGPSLKFISEMLMEEEVELHDSLALQSTEKSLYDALNNNNNNVAQNSNFESFFISSDDAYLQANPTSTFWMVSNTTSRVHSQFDSLDYEFFDHNEQLDNTVGQTELLEMLDSVLLSYHPMRTCGETEQGQSKKNEKYTKGGSNRGRPKKQGFESRAVTNLLLQIRQTSSPQGDASERLAHYFANALEARLAGTGTASYAEFNHDKLSPIDILKAYKMFITVCPFKNMSHLLANKTIEKLATGATTLHIVDFGIMYGYQWPCLIQALSKRPGGPPKLRITGIDFPQPGFERVANTGRCLAMFCERFGVPFEYNAIAQKWDTIRVEDLKIEKNHELLVVNSLYKLHNVLDEAEIAATFSPRNVVLNLIKSINPDMFIHGVINGTYNTPFLVARFREALFHFSSMFDMFEATVAREDRDRVFFEEQMFGKDAMNVIACEGAERIERPDTYKMWHLKSVEAVFRQLMFNPKIVSYVRSKVKKYYHKDFSVEEDGEWVLHGWKGRVNCAISCWQPSCT